jgi:acetyl esterase/lipase
MRIPKSVPVAAIALVRATPAAVAESDDYAVETDVISHEMTQDIYVWHPASDGMFPVVYAIHGLGGTGAGWDVVGPALAAHGVVVFAPDYRSTDGIGDHIAQDLECGYRYVREIAGDFGGDLTQPVVNVGHSLGAEMALYGGLDTTAFVPDGQFDVCFSGASRPDAIVSIAGCYYEFEGQRFPFDASQYGTGDARVVLVGGEDDEVCPAWQSSDATDALVAAGRQATYVEVPAADHMTLIGREWVDGEEVLVPDHPAAAEVVQLVLDVIHAEQGSAE